MNVFEELIDAMQAKASSLGQLGYRVQ